MTKKSGSTGPDPVPANAAQFDPLFAPYGAPVPPNLRTASR